MREGWEYKKLEEVCHSISDGNWIESKDQSPAGIRLIQTGNIGVGFYKDKGDKAKYISEETFKRLHCTEIFEGDVLVSRLPDPVGRACVLPDLGIRCITAVDCSILKIKSNVICSEWLTYYMQSARYFYLIKNQCTGSTRLRITRKKLAEVSVPVPPLSEQQEIVSYLDSSFAKIDAMKANAEKALNEAKALFQATLKEMLEPKEGWEEKKLSDIVDQNSAISYGIVQPGDNVIDGIPVVRPVDLIQKVISLHDGIKRTSKDNSDSYKRTLLNGKEILMCVRGTTGVVSLTDSSLSGCNVTRGIVPLKIDNDLLRLFTYYSIIAPIAAEFIQLNTRGAALKQINIADVKQIPISTPSLSEQHSIVTTLDSIKSKVDHLQANYDKITKECDAMKQAILRQVFE